MSALTDSNLDQKQNLAIFILLGASNLSRSFYGLKSCIKRCLFPRTAKFLHAMGPGRGYISRGGILNVTYTPIINCGILEAIHNQRKENEKVVALITDIGNDIMYGIPSDEIIKGLQYIFDRLDEFETTIFITLIPVDLKNEINEFYFHVLRQVFFPKSKTRYLQTLKTIEDVNKFIQQSSSENIKVITNMKQFCGVDKIHYSLFKSLAAWSCIADNLTKPFVIKQSAKLRVSELLLSIANNFVRTLFIDMINVTNKTKENF